MKLFERCKTCPERLKFVPSARSDKTYCEGLGPIVTYDGSPGTSYIDGKRHRVEMWSQKCAGDLALSETINVADAHVNQPWDIVKILNATGATSLRNRFINEVSILGVEPFNPDKSIVK